MCAINSLLSLVAWLLHIAGDGFSVAKDSCYSTPLPVNSLVNDRVLVAQCTAIMLRCMVTCMLVVDCLLIFVGSEMV